MPVTVEWAVAFGIVAKLAEASGTTSSIVVDQAAQDRTIAVAAFARIVKEVVVSSTFVEPGTAEVGFVRVESSTVASTA